MSNFTISDHLCSKVDPPINKISLEYIQYVTLNKNALKESSECACIYCFKKFNPSEITEWCDDFDRTLKKCVNETALCPYCGIDTIVPNSRINYNDDTLKKWHILGFQSHYK